MVVVRLITVPEHTGLLLLGDGVAGAEGSVRTSGPLNTAEVQPLAVTVKLVYEPAERPVISIWPLPLLVRVNGP